MCCLTRRGLLCGTALFGLMISGGDESRAADYFVAPTGSDANKGTQAAPFKTIQKAAMVMQAGDRCLIRAGTYRETVTPANSGKDKAPITFEAFEGERVVISGADILPGPWKPYKGEIVTTAMPWTLGPGKDQIFVDGVLRVQARHPNTHTTTSGRRPPPIGLPPFWLTYGDFTVSLNSPDVTNPTDLNQEEQDYWKGAIYVGWHNWAWCLQTGRVAASRNGSITVTNRTEQWWFPDSAPVYDKKFKWFNQGYLTGHLNALDQAGEWHQQDGTLYFWPDGDKPVSERVVEAKRRHLAFNLRDRQHIHLKGLRIVASSITLYNADHCVIDGCRMSFTSHFTEFQDGRDGYIDDHKVKTDKSAPQRGEVGVYVGGKENVIKNSVIKYSAGAGLFLAGYRTTVTNCIIRDCGYGGTYVGCLFISFDPLMTEEAKTGVRGGHTITYNQIHRSSRGLIQISSISAQDKPTVYDAMDIGYNWLHDASITGNDSGSIYCWSTTLGEGDRRTQWHHNLIWDNWSFTWSALAYPDNASFKVDIHDNILWYTSQSAAQRKEPPKFYKHNPPGDPVYSNNIEKRNYDGGVAGLQDSDYPGGKVFKTGPSIQDEVDTWYP